MRICVRCSRQFGTNFPPDFHHLPLLRSRYAPGFTHSHVKLSIGILCIGGAIIKTPYIPAIDRIEAVGRNLTLDLEESGHKLVRASTDLNKAMRALIKNYPNLVTLADKLPTVNRQHPYLRIQRVAYLYKYFR